MQELKTSLIELKEKALISKTPPVNCSYVTYPVINTYGDIILCCQDFQNKYVCGNIMERHLKDIWFDKKSSMIIKVSYSRMGNWEYRLKNFE